MSPVFILTWFYFFLFKPFLSVLSSGDLSRGPGDRWSVRSNSWRDRRRQRRLCCGVCRSASGSGTGEQTYSGCEDVILVSFIILPGWPTCPWLHLFQAVIQNPFSNGGSPGGETVGGETRFAYFPAATVSDGTAVSVQATADPTITQAGGEETATTSLLSHLWKNTTILPTKWAAEQNIHKNLWLFFSSHVGFCWWFAKHMLHVLPPFNLRHIPRVLARSWKFGKCLILTANLNRILENCLIFSALSGVFIDTIAHINLYIYFKWNYPVIIIVCCSGVEIKKKII